MIKDVDDFSFLILRIPYLPSNIPLKICYSSLGFQMRKTASTTTTSYAFTTSSKLLINRLIKQVGSLENLKRHSIKCFVNIFKPFRGFLTLQCLLLILWCINHQYCITSTYIDVMTILLLTWTILRTTLFRISQLIDLTFQS